MFAASLDGGSAQDYRFYKNNANDGALATYAAGSENNSTAYYTGLFPAVSAPPRTAWPVSGPDRQHRRRRSGFQVV